VPHLGKTLAYTEATLTQADQTLSPRVRPRRCVRIPPDGPKVATSKRKAR
jgi:hypothetical protein